jgi:hypothetical protein
MSSAEGIAVELDELANNMAGLAKVALYKIALDIIPALDDNSPVDTGMFRAEWDFKEEKGSPGTLAQVSIFNSMPYAAVIEEGSPKGGKPWASAGPKTIEQDGRIWSMQAVGGVIAPVMGDEGGSLTNYLTG